MNMLHRINCAPRASRHRQSGRRILLSLALAGIIWLGGLRALTAAPIGKAEGGFPVAQAEDAEDILQPDTRSVARVYFEDERLITSLAAELDIWTVNHRQGYFDALLSQDDRIYLTALGLRVSVDQPETDRLLHWPNVIAAETGPGIPNFPCYRTVEESYADLAQLAAGMPDMAQWIDIGDSWDKVAPGGPQGYDLHALIISNRAVPGPKAPLLLAASVHPRELATTELAVRFAEHLLALYGHDADITWLLDFHELHIIPYVNPDGRKRAEELLLWRKNTNRTDGCTSETPGFGYYGVDLNRNASYKWAECDSIGCSSANVCAQTYRGSGPASEPESRALLAYARALFGDRRGGDDAATPTDSDGLFVSLHSYGRLILYPWGWSAQEPPDGPALATLGRKFGYETNYSVCQIAAPGCLYQADGNHDDWMYGELGIPSYTFELGSSFFESCSDFETQIVEPNFRALIHALKAARRPYRTPSGPESVLAAVEPLIVTAGAAVTLTARMDDSRFFSGGYGDEPVQPIVAARYTISSPTWIPGTLTFAMAAADGLFDEPIEDVLAVLDTQGWRPGRYLLLTEGQDAAGNWGAPRGTFLDVLSAVHGLTVTPPRAAQRVELGADAHYSITVTNSGQMTDTFRISLADADWPVQIEPIRSPPLAPRSSIDIEIVVSTPANLDRALTGETRIEVLSISAPAVREVVELVTRAGYELLFPVFTR